MDRFAFITYSVRKWTLVYHRIKGKELNSIKRSINQSIDQSINEERFEVVG